MHDPLAPHRHDPNPDPPSADPAFVLRSPAGGETMISVPDLEALPQTAVADCFIISTGHGTSGPFTFAGVLLRDFLNAKIDPNQSWSQVEVVSGDGFGTRVKAVELDYPGRAGQILLAYALDGEAMSRRQGLVRLIVPSESDDALRQVKWVSEMNVRS